MRLPGLEKPDTLIDFVPDMVQVVVRRKQQKNTVIAQTIPEPGSNSNSVGDVAGGCSRSLVSLPHEVLRIILAQTSDPYDLAVFTCASLHSASPRGRMKFYILPAFPGCVARVRGSWQRFRRHGPTPLLRHPTSSCEVADSQLLFAQWYTRGALVCCATFRLCRLGLPLPRSRGTHSGRFP